MNIENIRIAKKKIDDTLIEYEKKEVKILENKIIHLRNKYDLSIKIIDTTIKKDYYIVSLIFTDFKQIDYIFLNELNNIGCYFIESIDNKYDYGRMRALFYFEKYSINNDKTINGG